ncbi:hypothetical protein F8M41_004023 [Gigaspora margarita]|uniref:Uncharacterized protein n=1 Tax=Gigaspora margarita TaxID=4874 RepID=A0A8H4A6Z7_GIGMA|nr:hypothetical protein F8M41_004023 [Gigaspora margarita]
MSDIIAGSHSKSNAKTNITEDSEIIAGSHSESNEETGSEVINITEDNAKIESLIQNERDIRKKLLEVLDTIQDKERKSKEDHMSSVYLNNILDLSNLETRRRVENSLNEDQHAWLNTILKKQTSDQTEEFKQYVGQFNERVCNRKQIPTLVRKSFILDRFDSYYYENYDIAHQILEHCGRKASLTKEHNDHVKLCRNAMRTLNTILQTIPREKARIYLADVLFTTKEINKIPYMAGNNNVCTTPLEDIPKKNKKVIKEANNSNPGSPCPGSPGLPLI